MAPRLHELLASAVKRAGSARALYAQDATLSRRGISTRVDRRARELAKHGVRAGDTVALSMGNVAELVVLLMACSKLDAVAMPLDPTSGDKTLVEASRRRPLRAVIRRPRGSDAPPPDYVQHRIVSRKRLSGSLLVADVLAPEAHPALPLPGGAELLAEMRGIGGVLRDVVLDTAALAHRIRAAVQALDLESAPRLLCSQPLTVPGFFDLAVLGWLGSDAPLVMAETASVDQAIAGAGGTGPLAVVDTLRGFSELARTVKAARRKLDIRPVVLQTTVGRSSEKLVDGISDTPGRQVLFLEEVGVLAHRVFGSKTFTPAPDQELRPGAAMQVGGHELLVHPPLAPVVTPAPERDDPGTPASDEGWLHTGYAARFDRSGALVEVLGRDDGLVWLEGRRGCLDAIEDAMLEHERVTWVRADLRPDSQGTPEIGLEYCASGPSTVDDLEEHAIGSLPPFMVPRSFDRRAAPPD